MLCSERLVCMLPRDRKSNHYSGQRAHKTSGGPVLRVRPHICSQSGRSLLSLNRGTVQPDTTSTIEMSSPDNLSQREIELDSRRLGSLHSRDDAELPRQELKPTDKGRDAWTVLIAGFVFEALFWGIACIILDA